MNPGPKMIIGLGCMLIGVGLMWHFGGRWLRLGRLPGDIAIERPGLRFYFPVVTSLLASVVVSAIFYLIQLLSNRPR